jgi:hypothetical protein
LNQRKATLLAALCELLVDLARSEISGRHADSHAREPGGLVVVLLRLVMPCPGWLAGVACRCWWGGEGNV